MSDVIDFNHIKNKISEKDKEDFRDFIFELYEKITTGEIFIGEITDYISEYGENKGYSKDKLLKLKETLIEELTFEAGISLENISEEVQGSFELEDFEEVTIKGIIKHQIFNGVNNFDMLIECGKVYILSKEQPDYEDEEFIDIVEEYKCKANLKEVEIVYLKESDRFKM